MASSESGDSVTGATPVDAAPEVAGLIQAVREDLMTPGIGEGVGPNGVGHVYYDTANPPNPTIGWGANLYVPYNQQFLEQHGYDVQAVIDGRQTISEEHARGLLDLGIGHALSDARAIFPNFDSLNPHAQQVLTEMSFNLGYPAFHGDANHHGFPALQAALAEVPPDYAAAADEVHIQNIGDARNEHYQDLMSQAATDPNPPQPLPPVVETAPPPADQVQLPAALRDTDFGTGPTDYRAEFTNFLAEPPAGASQTTLAIVSAMNSQMVENQVPMTHQHYENATESLSRGDSVVGFLKAENEDVLAGTGNGVAYEAGRTFHEVIGYFNGNLDCVVPANPPTDVQPASTLHEPPAHSHPFGEKPDDIWSGASPFAAATALGLMTGPQEAVQSPAPEPPLADQIQLPAGLLNTDFGTGGVVPADDHQSTLPDAFQAATISPPAEPVAEQPSTGFLSGIQDFSGSFSFPTSHTEPNDAQTGWGVAHDAAPSIPNSFDPAGSWFSSPPPAPDSVSSFHDNGNAFAPSYQDTGPSFGGSFGSDNSAPAFATSYESGHSNDSGYSHQDSGYSHQDSGYSHQDSGASSHDSGSHDTGGFGGGHDAGGGSNE